MRSLDPDAVLQRGFVRVTNSEGKTLTDRGQAETAGALTLKFRDGDVAAHTAGTPPAPPSPPRKTRPPRKAPSTAQEDLFG